MIVEMTCPGLTETRLGNGSNSCNAHEREKKQPGCKVSTTTVRQASQDLTLTENRKEDAEERWRKNEAASRTDGMRDGQIC
jgi:hypothetical protein